MRVVKNHVFKKKEVKEAYKMKMDEEWAKVKGKEYTSVDHQCESFWNAVINTSGSVRWYKSVWNEE